MRHFDGWGTRTLPQQNQTERVTSLAVLIRQMVSDKRRQDVANAQRERQITHLCEYLGKCTEHALCRSLAS